MQHRLKTHTDLNSHPGVQLTETRDAPRPHSLGAEHEGRPACDPQTGTQPAHLIQIGPLDV